MHCYQILITGNVFKTGFRYFLKEKATLLGINGSVYYKTSRSVAVIAVGTIEALNSFLDFCQVGDKLFLIKKMEVTEIQPKEFLSFEVVDEAPMEKLSGGTIPVSQRETIIKQKKQAR